MSLPWPRSGVLPAPSSAFSYTLPILRDPQVVARPSPCKSVTDPSALWTKTPTEKPFLQEHHFLLLQRWEEVPVISPGFSLKYVLLFPFSLGLSLPFLSPALRPLSPPSDLISVSPCLSLVSSPCPNSSSRSRSGKGGHNTDASKFALPPPPKCLLRPLLAKHQGP